MLSDNDNPSNGEGRDEHNVDNDPALTDDPVVGESDNEERETVVAEASPDAEAGPSADAPDEGDGEDAPAPLISWEDLGVSEERIVTLREHGYEQPMEVQWETYALVLDGRDLMVQSRTGSGKTAAFGLPLSQQALESGAARKPQMLALAPTRELAIQVANELSLICEGTDIETCALYGGAALGPQIDKLRAGVHLVCGTPGRVLDHIRRRTLAVDEIKVLVLDECDEMLSMGFYEELSSIMERLPAREQTLLFSATIPDDVQRLAHKYLKDPERLILSEDFVGVKEITHAYYMVSGLARPRDLMRVLEVEAPESAIIFCNTREDTANVASYLQKQGLVAEAISSDFSQAEREQTMQRMKEKKLQYLCATDVAARGIDIAALSHVINYKFPDNADIYVHRTGRTGRAGKSGIALSLISPQELGDFYYMKLTHDIVPEERWLPTKTELAARKEGERLVALEINIRELDEILDPEFVSLAKRVWHSRRAEEIVAHLLQERFGKPMRKPLPRPEPRRESREDHGPRRDHGDRPRRDEGRGGRRDDGRRRDGRSGGFDSRRRDSDRGGRGGPRRDGDSGGRSGPRRDFDSRGRDDRGSREPRDEIKIYMNVGRDDGLSPASVIQFLTSNGDIEGRDVNKIQIRDKFTFVGVNKTASEGLVDRINGKDLMDKPVKVELARS